MNRFMYLVMLRKFQGPQETYCWGLEATVIKLNHDILLQLLTTDNYGKHACGCIAPGNILMRLPWLNLEDILFQILATDNYGKHACGCIALSINCCVRQRGDSKWKVAWIGPLSIECQCKVIRVICHTGFYPGNHCKVLVGFRAHRLCGWTPLYHRLFGVWAM